MGSIVLVQFTVPMEDGSEGHEDATGVPQLSPRLPSVARLLWDIRPYPPTPQGLRNFSEK